MTRSEFLKTIAVLGLTLPALSQTLPESLVFNSTELDPDAELYITNLSKIRSVSEDEKQAIRHFYRLAKKEGHWNNTDCLYIFSGPGASKINWINPNQSIS